MSSHKGAIVCRGPLIRQWGGRVPMLARMFLGNILPTPVRKPVFFYVGTLPVVDNRGREREAVAPLRELTRIHGPPFCVLRRIRPSPSVHELSTRNSIGGMTRIIANQHLFLACLKSFSCFMQVETLHRKRQIHPRHTQQPTKQQAARPIIFYGKYCFTTVKF